MMGMGRGNHQHPCDTTQTSHYLPQQSLWVDVTVAHRGHGDGGPPEGGGDAGELGGVLVLLGEEDQAGEDHDAHGQEEDEQAQLVVAPPQCEAQGLQARGVAGQLQDPQYPHDPEDLDHAPHVLELQHALVGLGQEDGDVVGQDGQQVDDVQRALEELPLVGGGEEAQQVLHGEPGDAHGLHVGQLGVVVGLAELVGHLELWQGVERQCNRGQNDEQDRYNGQDLEGERERERERGGGGGVTY